MQRNKKQYSEIVSNKKDWPIVQLSEKRKAFIEEVADEVCAKILSEKSDYLRKEIEQSIHMERVRVRNNAWKVDPQDESLYWKKIQYRLADLINKDNQTKRNEEEKVLREIVENYLEEIAGRFKKSRYKLARKIITFGFARLLNAARVKGITALFSRELDLDDKVNIVGEVEHIRKLSKVGTVVMVPTHFSNLDSVLIGWVIQYLGLPPFLYGANMNLFNIKVFAYFMNSLGAYKVDKRKTNAIYIETLKTYVKKTLEDGCSSLFFPSGGRSLSGEIHQGLKTGMLSAAMEAQRELYRKEGEVAKKIFIVPVVLNYNFVLEAPSLIKEYLQRTGKERYYKEIDEYSTSYQIASFMLKFFTKGSNISVSIGRGMDILGNYVNDEGRSADKNGNHIHCRDYFVRNGQITVDSQRELEYVHVLADNIIKEYRKSNRVFASHLVAFTAFKMLERKHSDLDLYSVLRLPEDDLVLDYDKFKKNFKKLRKQLDKLYDRGKLNLAEHMNDKAKEAIAHGLDNLGLYHNKRPLVRKEDKIIIEDTNTLYYYHNRMNGYGLEKYI